MESAGTVHAGGKKPNISTAESFLTSVNMHSVDPPGNAALKIAFSAALLSVLTADNVTEVDDPLALDINNRFD